MSRSEAILDKLKTISDWKLWGIFFVYSLGVSLLIQLILLPYIFPQWHAGSGLIIGGDFVRFHTYASEQAAAVSQLGWDNFSFYPRGQFVSGIASVFYIFLFPVPAAVLPLNAVLHATAGLLCFKIINKLTQERIPSLLGASLFVFFPSSLRWVSQMHNDNYAVLGAILFLYGWTQLDTFLETRSYRPLLFGFIGVFGGLLLIGVVRDYLLEIYFVASILLGLYLVGKMIISMGWRSYWPGIGGVVLLILFQRIATQSVYLPLVQSLRQGQDIGEILEDSVLQSDLAGTEEVLERSPLFWEETSYLPVALDDKIHELAVKRHRLALNWSDGGSGIDADVDLNSSGETLLYVPRSLQIALFAPFPNDWFDQGTKPPSNFMRRVAAIEMGFVYVLFLFLPFGLLRWRKSSTLYLVLLYSLFFLTIYAIATPNVGNLYRFRYPFFMLLVSLSATSSIHLISNRIVARQRAGSGQGLDPVGDMKNS